jgi:hypothetical protein
MKVAGDIEEGLGDAGRSDPATRLSDEPESQPPELLGTRVSARSTIEDRHGTGARHE